MGSPSGQFGGYEWLRLLHWSTLLASLAVAVLTWGATELLPTLAQQGGYWAAAAAVVTPIIKALILKFTDNTNKPST